jgi:hypothetical protein
MKPIKPLSNLMTQEQLDAALNGPLYDDRNSMPDIFVSYSGDEQEKRPWTYQIYFHAQLLWTCDQYIENHQWGTN